MHGKPGTQMAILQLQVIGLKKPTLWELKSGLLGFTQFNNAHNGERLGQALFKIIKRVGIVRKVSYLTS